MQAEPNHAHMEALPPSEWSRLVGLCAHISGSPDAAEDLAQESLIEAWRHAGKLRNPNAQRAWLSGIARNVALRWRRQRAHDAERQERLEAQERAAPLRVTSDHAGVAVEHDELAVLLDRALGMLPVAAREVLTLRYIEELGNREIADRLGLSASAVAVRLHRGKMSLRQALAEPELRGDAAAFGFVDPETANWRHSRIWCPFCGRHRLKTRIDPDTGLLFAVCDGACTDSGAIIGGTRMQPESRNLTSTKSILARELVNLHGFYRQALADDGGTCLACGRHLPLERWSPDRPLAMDTAHPHGIRLLCRACGSESSASLWHLMLDMPETQRFWRRHPRIEAMPVREIERDGTLALVSGFASTDGARLEVVSARDTLDVLHIDGSASR